ncbi:TadE/TadG family type IV pilus assembly protein [Pseudidiomarina sp.]|uniref:TadE/TadG family type IV pilus assembly protein n=1 Tax=Pseudidiomarina sp. TaxID=2081707 RepID=UPI003A96A4A2
MQIVPRCLGSHQRGVATIEAMLLTPLIFWMLLAALQLIWLFWAQHLLHNTSHYVLRAGQLQHGDLSAMRNVLATGMASTQLQWNVDQEDESEAANLREGAWRATVATLLHARLASTIQLHSPTVKAQEQFNEQRYDLRKQQWVTEIAIDHALARTANMDVTDNWLAARQLDIEIWWCMPLQVPLVAPVLQTWRQLFDSPAQRFCRLREALVGEPMWPLISRRTGPMLSGFRADKQPNKHN